MNICSQFSVNSLLYNSRSGLISEGVPLNVFFSEYRLEQSFNEKSQLAFSGVNLPVAVDRC